MEKDYWFHCPYIPEGFEDKDISMNNQTEATLQYILGDVTKAPQDVILHGVNCQGVFNAGVAKAIKKEFPEAYDTYADNYMNMNLGEVLYGFSNDKIIAHCFTQKTWGRDNRKQYVNYDAIKSCFRLVCEFCKEYDIKEVAMPKIGSGLGKGKWSIIEDYVMDELVNKGISVYVYSQ